MNLFLLIIIIVALILLSIKKETRRVIFEGVIIGVASGVIISFSTDSNYRASIKGPIILLGKNIFHGWKYMSKDWTDIRVVKTDKLFNVEATNVASGAVMKFNTTSLDKLPSDLRYAIISDESTIVKPLPPQNSGENVEGGSLYKYK